MTNTNTLLSKTYHLIEKYEAIATQSGIRFNIFHLMDLANREVKTHSRFLAELLDPKGEHGQGKAYLALFLSELKIEDFDLQNVKVEVERFIGYKNEDATEGGYIDIIISNGIQCIIIENKIYAGDQINQLLRYHNYGQSAYKGNFRLYYLTLHGKEASEYSTSGLNNNQYTPISYAEDILFWLEKCREKSEQQPILREAIAQYIHLIKGLTNQTEDQKMKKELIDTIMESPENLASFFELQKTDVVNGVKKQLFEEFKNQLKQTAERLDLVANFEIEGFLQFYLPSSKKKFYLSFCFCSGYNNLVFQAHTEEFVDEDYKNRVLKAMPPRGTGFYSIWIQWVENDIRYWDYSGEPWLMIENGKMAEKFEQKLAHALELLKGVDL